MKVERKEAFFRILVLIVTGIVLGVWGYVVFLLMLVNWLIALFAAKRNRGIAEFCEYWNTESYKFYKYLSGMTNERPFPFSELERFSKFRK